MKLNFRKQQISGKFHKLLSFSTTKYLFNFFCHQYYLKISTKDLPYWTCLRVSGKIYILLLNSVSLFFSLELYRIDMGSAMSFLQISNLRFVFKYVFDVFVQSIYYFFRKIYENCWCTLYFSLLRFNCRSINSWATFQKSLQL